MVDHVLRELHPGMPLSEGLTLLGYGDTQGGGGSEQVEGYALVYLPSVELPWLLLRWGTVNPYLYVRYENGKLVSATIK